MLEKKNIYVIDDIFDSIRGEIVHKTKKGNEWNVTDLLACRRKVEFRRLKTPYKYVESDFTRQGKLGTLLHRSVQLELEKLGWITEMNGDPDATKFTKDIGKYRIHMRADGIMYDGEENIDKLLEIKVPMWNSTDKKGIPDYYKYQVGAYLNITGASECKLMILAKNAFSEHTLTEVLEDDDLIWMIEEGGMSPSFDAECKNCFYYDICDVRKEK